MAGEPEPGGGVALRALARDLLRAPERTPTRDLERRGTAAGLDARDRALLRRLVGTGWRRMGSLRAIAQHLTRGRAKPELSSFLHVGLAQTLFLDRVPDHAAVSTTVSAATDALGLAKSRTVNAVLREALRLRREGASGDPTRDLVDRPWHLDAPVFRDPETHPYLWFEDALSLPAALAKAWDRRHGREVTERLARQALQEPPLPLRVCRGTPEAAREALGALGVEPLRAVDDTLLLPPDATATVVASEPFRAGDWTVQGAAGTRAAKLVDARDGETVLDLCAAPGGKTAVLAAAGARVVACDADAERLERAGETLARLGLSDRVERVVSDGAAAVADRTFDAALVDAPCTNTGVLAARPEARWRFGPAAARSLQDLQARLLDEAAARVREGGRLVWSTCSLEPAENRAQVRAFLDRAGPAWELAAEHETLPDPDTGPADGGYAARLERRRDVRRGAHPVGLPHPP